MKNINTALVLNDLLLFAFISLAVYRWQYDKNTALMYLWIGIAGLLLIRQIRSHWLFYRKEKRFY